MAKLFGNRGGGQVKILLTGCRYKRLDDARHVEHDEDVDNLNKVNREVTERVQF